MVTSLDEIDGIGGKTADRIQEAGIQSVSDLAKADPQELADIKGVTHERAQKFVKDARRSAAVIQSGAEAADYFDSLESVATGIDEFDEVLDGGWEQEDIVALYGDTNTGKSQISLNSLAAAVEDTGEPGVYIETERKEYDHNRIRQLSQEEETQDNVYRVTGHGLEEQYNAYDAVLSNFDSVGLVVVDSFTSRFRKSDDFGGIGTHQNRSEVMRDHLNKIEEISEELECPVLIICQIYENSDPFGQGGVIMYGGSLLRHEITYSVLTEKGSGEMVKATLEGLSSNGEETVELSITDTGIHSK